MDKINDFYEFRLMALNTEKQTREGRNQNIQQYPSRYVRYHFFFSLALGLPLAAPVKRPAIETRPAVVRLVDLKYSTEDSLLIERALGRSSSVKIEPESIPSTSKKRNEKQATVPVPPAKKSRKDVTCTICTDKYFEYQSDLNE
jgi:hypothetical protein